MKASADLIVALHRRVLALYPAAFRAEFGAEMQETFIQALTELQGARRRAEFFLREMFDLPGSLLQQYWEHWFHLLQGDSMIAQNEFSTSSSRGEALLGALPSLAFGLVSMLGKLTFDTVQPGIYLWLGSYFFSLIGLLTGWIKGFPRWAYAYLGWSLVFAWWWTTMSTQGLRILGHTFSYGEHWGWRAWLPLACVALLALLWTRSLQPIKRFFRGIQEDWTRLSFALFTFPAWFTLLYDENHHPYLLFFMLGSTLAFFGGTYMFSRLNNVIHRMAALIGSLSVSLAFFWICEGTWDLAAYYHLPPFTEPWYSAMLRWAVVMIVIAVTLFSPGVISLFGRHQRKA